MAYAVVTGASNGIGRELAALLARDGHDLVVVARSRAGLDRVRAVLERDYGIRVKTFAADLSEDGAPERLHEFTRSRGLQVDTLVNNAGFSEWTTYLDGDWDRQRRMMRLNMEALATLTRLYGRDMRDAGDGRILNISSVASMMAGPYMAMYFASKAFVRSLSEAVAYELRGTGVTVTCVCPGPTSTGFAKAAHMSGRNFFTMTRPATARGLALYAYRRMNAGDVLAYHGAFTKAGAFAERALPRALTRRIAAFMNGGRPKI
ncbi:SDR family NAD(P)-dependent oxidoreductase [Bifidobacterium callitrichos]|uniref:Short-chain dehydrogenase n=1 Tax=Bifidobacterium callitrichos DSM 23973 TaxID=1437609 RepID=A0A087A167_9BIFI|nr:SDR family oxidoreductase [Bifidobacterium callitrichos]KFI52517.1 short-chain dehydrogenase [Bifidobacterium callitrichos DSM 23973]